MVKRIIKRFFIALVVVLVALLVWPLSYPLFETPYSTIVTEKNGKLLSGQIAADGQWRFPLGDSIPEKFKTSIMMFEDEYFKYHPGVNPVSMGRALLENIREGRIVRGGSTITMQVARLIRGNRKRTVIHKIDEIFLAFRLELYLKKEKILQLYTAHAPFGGNVVGLDAASWRYYGRHPWQLSWAEMATLAVLPNSPSLIFPGRKHNDLKAKRNRLLNKLHDREFLTETELLLSKDEPLPKKPKQLPDMGKHILTRAIGEGKSGTYIKTTIDENLQYRLLRKVDSHHKTLSANEVHNAAAIIIEVKTGRVMAYAGNTNTTTIHSPHVDIITAPRSTGSILKPLLYAAAIDKGLITPKQLLPDIPTFFQGFSPKNFDNRYEGAVAAEDALRKSLNIPFVYLLKEYTYEQLHKDLTDLGMTTLTNVSAHYGLSLILGGAEASLWELTAMYAGLVRTLESYYSKGADNGYQRDVLFASNYVKDEIKEKHSNFLSAGAIWWMLRGMQELQRPEEMSGWYQFASSRKLAWKTGTSYGFRDAWAIGTDGKYVVGVWAGNADGEGRPGLTGIQAASPLMFDIFDMLPSNGDFLKTPPSEMEQVLICSKSGYRAGINCSEKTFLSLPKNGSFPPICPNHIVLHFDEEGKNQVTADCYNVNKIKTASWFQLPPVQAWYYKLHHADYKSPPGFLQNCGSSTESNNVMEMIYPRHSTKLYIPRELDGQPGRCVLEAAHIKPLKTIYWHLDDKYVGATTSNHQLSVNPAYGKHKLHLVDEEGNEIDIDIEILSSD